VHVQVNGAAYTATLRYDEAAQNMAVELAGITPADRVEVVLRCVDRSWRDRTDRRAQRCRQLLRAFRMNVNTKQRIDEQLERELEDPAILKALGVSGSVAHVEALRSVIACEDL
jgi:hypothetical protein